MQLELPCCLSAAAPQRCLNLKHQHKWGPHRDRTGFLRGRSPSPPYRIRLSRCIRRGTTSTQGYREQLEGPAYGVQDASTAAMKVCASSGPLGVWIVATRLRGNSSLYSMKRSPGVWKACCREVGVTLKGSFVPYSRYKARDSGVRGLRGAVAPRCRHARLKHGLCDSGVRPRELLVSSSILDGTWSLALA